MVTKRIILATDPPEGSNGGMGLEMGPEYIEGHIPSPISISQIRSVINILSSDDLADDVIQSAIDRAHAYVWDLAGRSSATQNIINAAELNHSAYLAYQAYADRVVQQLPGFVNDQGIFDPAAAVILRATRDKLDGLKQISDESIAYLQYNFPKNEVAAVIPMADAENYPDQYKMSTFRSAW